MPYLTVVHHRVVAKRGAAGRVAVRETFAAELASAVLVYWHEFGCELTVFEEAVHVFVESVEDHVAVLLGCGDSNSSERNM